MTVGYLRGLLLFSEKQSSINKKRGSLTYHDAYQYETKAYNEKETELTPQVGKKPAVNLICPMALR